MRQALARGENYLTVCSAIAMERGHQYVGAGIKPGKYKPAMLFRGVLIDDRPWPSGLICMQDHVHPGKKCGCHCIHDHAGYAIRRRRGRANGHVAKHEVVFLIRLIKNTRSGSIIVDTRINGPHARGRISPLKSQVLIMTRLKGLGGQGRSDECAGVFRLSIVKGHGNARANYGCAPVAHTNSQGNQVRTGRIIEAQKRGAQINPAALAAGHIIGLIGLLQVVCAVHKHVDQIVPEKNLSNKLHGNIHGSSGLRSRGNGCLSQEVIRSFLVGSADIGIFKQDHLVRPGDIAAAVVDHSNRDLSGNLEGLSILGKRGDFNLKRLQIDIHEKDGDGVCCRIGPILDHGGDGVAAYGQGDIFSHEFIVDYRSLNPVDKNRGPGTAHPACYCDGRSGELCGISGAGDGDA